MRLSHVIVIILDDFKFLGNTFNPRPSHFSLSDSLPCSFSTYDSIIIITLGILQSATKNPVRSTLTYLANVTYLILILILSCLVLSCPVSCRLKLLFLGFLLSPPVQLILSPLLSQRRFHFPAEKEVPTYCRTGAGTAQSSLVWVFVLIPNHLSSRLVWFRRFRSARSQTSAHKQ